MKSPESPTAVPAPVALIPMPVVLAPVSVIPAPVIPTPIKRPVNLSPITVEPAARPGSQQSLDPAPAAQQQSTPQQAATAPPVATIPLKASAELAFVVPSNTNASARAPTGPQQVAAVSPILPGKAPAVQGRMAANYSAEPEAVPPPVMMPEGAGPPALAPIPQSGPHWAGELPPGTDPAQILPEGMQVADPQFDQDLYTLPWRKKILRRAAKGLSDLYYQPYNNIGVGRERVMLAPFEIENAQPFTNIRLRYESYYNQQSPDRAEFFWAHAGATGGMGPTFPEKSVNYQEYHLYTEVAAKEGSVAIDVPLRAVDPVVNGNTTGFGDLSMQEKIVLLDGEKWLITQFFKSTFNTGTAVRGMGTGHISLEPGLLFRYKYSPITYFHGEIRYWIPIAGDPIFSGSVIRYSLGASRVLYDCDSFAIMPTCEFVAWSVENGSYSSYPLGIPTSAADTNIENMTVGMRLASDKASDFGLVELGISGGFALSHDRWYGGLVRLEARFSY
jgi:hypothetical protein